MPALKAANFSPREIKHMRNAARRTAHLNAKIANDKREAAAQAQAAALAAKAQLKIKQRR